MLECIRIPMYRSFFDGDGLAQSIPIYFRKAKTIGISWNNFTNLYLKFKSNFRAKYFLGLVLVAFISYQKICLFC